ncbi:MAG: hypothetical protein ACXWZY_01125 [Gaiellaceae bacterium]
MERTIDEVGSPPMSHLLRPTTWKWGVKDGIHFSEIEPEPPWSSRSGGPSPWISYYMLSPLTAA